jgi:hypothetical protein
MDQRTKLHTSVVFATGGAGRSSFLCDSVYSNNGDGLVGLAGLCDLCQ